VADEGHFLTFLESEVKVFEELSVSGGVLEGDISEIDVALDSRLEHFGIFSGLDLIFVFRINDLK
jgi:hypothetical protein